MKVKVNVFMLNIREIKHTLLSDNIKQREMQSLCLLKEKSSSLI